MEHPATRLKECEALLCSFQPPSNTPTSSSRAQHDARRSKSDGGSSNGGSSSSFAAYLSDLAAGTGNGPCTAVWTAGTIAYRCRTCQTSASSAVCISCFKAGGHDAHDYVIYKSPAGGCCDCGDLSSWRLDGCCRQHRPASLTPDSRTRNGSATSTPNDGSSGTKLEPAHEAALSAVLSWMLLRFVSDLEVNHTHRNAFAAGRASSLAVWLQQLAALAPVRILGRVVLTRPMATWASASAPSASPNSGSSSPDPAGVSSAVVAQLWEGCAAIGTVMLRSAQQQQQQLQSDDRIQDCLLQRLLRCLPSCPEALLTEVTTLLLLLLYDAQFKFECTVQLLDQYDGLLGCIMDAPGPGKHPLTTALDRLTVQLFNCEEVTLRLVAERQLIENFMTVLWGLTQTAVVLLQHFQEPGTSHDPHSTNNPQRHRFMVLFSCYRRVLSDINIVLHHPQAVQHLLDTPGGAAPAGHPSRCAARRDCPEGGRSVRTGAAAVSPAAVE
ncbi:MAG: hypothetical protein WDW36_005706 [Sanguina aurantia]